MELKNSNGILIEDLVGSIQSVFRELSAIKKSLSIRESGPIGVKSAAQHLEVSQQKIYLEVEEGDIPHYQDRPGSKIYFFREELDQWVKEKRRICLVLKRKNIIQIYSVFKFD